MFSRNQRDRTTAWSLFGNVTVNNQQKHESIIQSLATTVEDMKKLAGTGAGITSAVAGFLGDHELARRAGSLEQKLLK